jgi:hypothetical protein
MTFRLAPVAFAVLAFVATGPIGAGVAHAQSKCAGTKRKEAGKKADRKLKCWSKGVKKGAQADPNCLGKAEFIFGSKWDKAEAKGGCATTGDKTAIENKVDAFVLDVSAELPGAPTPTTTTTTTTLPPLCGNGNVDPGEECDGTNLGGATCGGGSPGGGFLPSCNADCTLDCSTCPGGVCVASCAEVVPGQPIANTYQLTGVAGPKVCTTGSAANALHPCNADTDCGGTSGGCLQTPWVTADGFAFQFPTGIKTTFTIAAADSAPTCSHTACISCGDPNAACVGIPGCGSPPGAPTNGCSKNACCDTPGFTVPTFNVPILGGLCGRVDQSACGTGVVNTSRPQTGDNEVIKAGDTTDPGADCTYGTLDDPLPAPCTPIGAGSDGKGKIVRTTGNGSADSSGVHFRITSPMLATVWQDSMNPCPDGSTFDNGEGLIAQLVLNAEPSSAGMTARFQDLSGDGCAHAGAGFSTAAPDGPVTIGSSVAHGQSYDGSTGPVQVAGGPVFSGVAPLYDIGFVAILPSGPAALAPAETCSCVPVAGCPE